MSDEQKRIRIAEAMGAKWYRGLSPVRAAISMQKPTGGTWRECERPERIEDCDFLGLLPDYLNDLNAMHEAERVLNDPRYSVLVSSRPYDHAPFRYRSALAKVCGVKMREELVISVATEDKPKLNFRPGPYPTPIELPKSATVVGHFIPCYGYENALISATARQRADAFLAVLGPAPP